MSQLKIKEIRIKNFRGYSEEKIFNFDDNSRFVLISGVNGFGKTSLLDAIEWCFTGNIKRLQRELLARKEQNEGNRGYLKNINFPEQETFVEIKLSFKTSEIITKRMLIQEQINDKKLSAGDFSVEIPDNIALMEKQKIVELIEKLQNNDFYHKNTCSYDKNINLYSQGKKDLANYIYEYLYDKEKADNYSDKLTKIKKILTNEIKKTTDLISLFKTQLESSNIAKDKIVAENLNIDNISNYPMKLYEEEQLPENLLLIENLETRGNEINKEISNLKIILDFLTNFNKYSELYKYNTALKFQKNWEHLDTIIKYYEDTKNNLSLISLNFNENEKIDEKIKQIKNLIKSISEYRFNNIQDINAIFNTDNTENNKIITLLKDDCIPLIKTINDLDVSEAEKPIIELKKRLEQLKVFQKTEYGEICPLCRNNEKNFRDINLEETLDITISELSKKAEQQSTKINELNLLKNDIEKELNILIQTKLETSKKYIEEIKTSLPLDASILNLNDNYLAQLKIQIDKSNLIIKNFQNKYPSLNFELFHGIDAEENIDENTKNRLINTLLNEKRANIKKLLDFQFDFAPLDEILKNYNIDNFSTTAKLTEEDKQTIEIEINNLKQKISLLENLKNNASLNINLMKLTSEINKISKELAFNEEKLVKLKNYDKLSKESNTKIQSLITKTNINISKSLNENIQIIYKRITRHTNFKISFPEDKGRTVNSTQIICQNEDKEVPSQIVMSTGQISTIALSIFWAIVNTKRNSNFRCYFLDDPIQSIDDLNILSFVDLIRAELQTQNSEKYIFDQLFFTTCDNNLENLIRHKMKTFNIPYNIVKFTDYETFEIKQLKG